MSSDLIERLRARATDFRNADNYLNEAADEIERLRAEILSRGNVIGRIAAHLLGRQNNVSDEDVVAAAANIGSELLGTRQRAERAEQKQSNIGHGHDDWVRKHYDEAQPVPFPDTGANGEPVYRPKGAQQQAEPTSWIEEHVETFVSQYNDVYCHQRKAGVGGGDAERAAMQQVLILALGAYKPRITAAQVEQIKRLADEYAQMKQAHGAFCNADSRKFLDESRTALHAALDALVAKGE